MKRPPLRVAAVATLAVAWVLLVFLAAAQFGTRMLMLDDAKVRLSGWTAHTTPWRWLFDGPDEVVWPGSVGFERHEEGVSTLSGTIPDGNADLSLGLRGDSIDLERVDGAFLRIDTAQPLRASLLAGPGIGNEIAAVDVAPPGGIARLERIAATTLSRTNVLRLHLETAPGARVQLHFAVLRPRGAWTPEACVDRLPCDAPIPVVKPPYRVFPESILAWRDATMRARPAAIVIPRSSSGRALVREIRSTMCCDWVWLFALAPVFVGLVSRLRTRETTRRTAMLELALVFTPWIVLHGIGVPVEAGSNATWVFVGSLAGALLLRPLAPTTWRGDAAAWRASLKFLAAAMAVIGVLALVNAFDADGFVPRNVSTTKAWQYPLWALLQQAILLRAIAPRMRLATGSDGYGALAAGALFGALHVPNFALMVATFVAGTAWAGIGRRHPALLPLAVVHALAGIALVWAAPGWLLRSAEVGARYLMAP